MNKISKLPCGAYPLLTIKDLKPGQIARRCDRDEYIMRARDRYVYLESGRSYPVDLYINGDAPVVLTTEPIILTPEVQDDQSTN